MRDSRACWLLKSFLVDGVHRMQSECSMQNRCSDTSVHLVDIGKFLHRAFQEENPNQAWNMLQLLALRYFKLPTSASVRHLLAFVWMREGEGVTAATRQHVETSRQQLRQPHLHTHTQLRSAMELISRCRSAIPPISRLAIVVSPDAQTTMNNQWEL